MADPSVSVECFLNLVILLFYSTARNTVPLKGQCHEIFCLRFFSWITNESNLPPVSTTPVANCHRYQRHRRQICHRCQRHRWQIMGTISGCRHLKVNLKTEIYMYVNSTSQRCPNKIIKILLLEYFFHLPPVSWTPVVHLEPRISPRILRISPRIF